MGCAEIIQGKILWGLFIALIAGICLAGVIDSGKIKFNNNSDYYYEGDGYKWILSVGK